MTLELCSWVVHMGKVVECVQRDEMHTSCHSLSSTAHKVPVGVQYAILKRASRRSMTMSRQYQEMRDARAVQLGSSYGYQVLCCVPSID